MIRRIFSKSSNLFLLAGVLILLFSAVGIIQSVLNKDRPIEKSAYRYYLKTSAVISNTPIVRTTSPVENDTQGMSGNHLIHNQVLNTEIGYINSTLRPELSTPNIPTRIVISKIKLDAPVVVSDFNYTDVDGETFGQWMAPSEFAAGWQPDSALLDVIGNTVINGHHNAFGEVFGKLVDLNVGDVFSVYAGDKEFRYIIANRMIVQERFMDAQTRLENARWLARSDDERLTLVTCWPKETNTHRLILVARPLDED